MWLWDDEPTSTQHIFVAANPREKDRSKALVLCFSLFPQTIPHRFYVACNHRTLHSWLLCKVLFFVLEPRGVQRMVIISCCLFFWLNILA